LAGRKPRALSFSRNEAGAVMVDEDAGREPWQFSDHRETRYRTRDNVLRAATQSRANQERASPYFQRVAEECAAGGFVG
jgi:hypothetical protein